MATVSVGSTSERFDFIKRYGHRLGVRYLCRWLRVSPSGYYAFLKRPESKRSIEDQVLLIKIKQAYVKSRRTYGSPRVYKALKKQGIRVGKKRVERLMRAAGLRGRAIKYYRTKAAINRFYNRAENLRLQGEKTTGTNQQWVADLTYIKVGKKWCYLAMVMDVYSRRIIAWSLGRSKSAKLTKSALLKAIRKRRPPKGLIYHTDRGIEYRAFEIQKILDHYGIVPSCNRAYHSIDNAEMESFFKTLKGDVIRGNVYNSAQTLRAHIHSYIHHFYNPQRLHSSLGYVSPIEYEAIAA